MKLIALAFSSLINTQTATVVEPLPGTMSWILSAHGVEAGHTALAAGLAYVQGTPSVDLRLLHGLTETVALDVELATLGYAQLARAGARLQMVDRPHQALALRASLFEGHVLDQAGSRVWIAAGPGLIGSFGTASVQVTASVDLALGLHDSASDDASVGVRPAVGVEVPLDLGLGLVVESGAILGTTGEALPFFAAGLAW